MRVVVFEDDALEGFGPLTALRHAGFLKWGSKSLLEAQIHSISDATDVGLWGRDWLKETTRESNPAPYNEKAEGTTLFINAAARPGPGLLALTSWMTPFAAYEGGRLVAARTSARALSPGVVGQRAGKGLGRDVDRLEAPRRSILGGYWDVIEGNGLAIAEQAPRFADREPLPDRVEVRGPVSSLRVEGGSEIEPFVTFDARLGPVVIERGASVESFSRIMGPCFIGRKTKVLSALIGGGTSVFESCKIGGQVENSVILSYTNKAHHGYVGDSYVGEWVNLGAGSTFSNLKNTYGSVRVASGGQRFDSEMVKLGPAVGDMCKVSIGALVYSGKGLGTGCQVSGLARSNVPSFSHYDGFTGKGVELILRSVIETQRRMMERRDRELSRAQEKLVRLLFKETAGERRSAGVTKGRVE